jgi:hypothetical protein
MLFGFFIYSYPQNDLPASDTFSELSIYDVDRTLSLSQCLFARSLEYVSVFHNTPHPRLVRSFNQGIRIECGNNKQAAMTYRLSFLPKCTISIVGEDRDLYGSHAQDAYSFYYSLFRKRKIHE